MAGSPDGSPDCAALMPLPADAGSRIVLAAIRHMAVGGIRDAFAASLFVNTFGMNFRQPLVLMRAVMVETARASQGTIRVVPCCAPRMTRDEHCLIDAIRCAATAPGTAASLLRALTGNDAIDYPLTAAAALAQAFAGHGMPLADRSGETTDRLS